MSTFDATTSADQVLAGVDLSNRSILVTGVSAGGVGAEIARSLVRRGASVIGTARNPDKARLAADTIRSQAGLPGSLELLELDLASLGSVRRVAESLLARGRPLAAIIANAGIMATPLRRTVDGYESQFATNHLGHFALVNRLVPLLAPGGRVACVSSAGHRRSNIDLDDLNFDNTPYDPLLAYGRSKTAVTLFAVEFDRRHRHQGLRATAVHPGAIMTDTVRAMVEAARKAGHDPASAYAWKTLGQGAATSAWAAVVAAGDDVGGRYCEDCHVAPVDDDQSHGYGVRSYALDEQAARALWLRSEDMVGTRF